MCVTHHYITSTMVTLLKFFAQLKKKQQYFYNHKMFMQNLSSPGSIGLPIDA